MMKKARSVCLSYCLKNDSGKEIHPNPKIIKAQTGPRVKTVYRLVDCSIDWGFEPFLKTKTSSFHRHIYLT
jgi:hypothetical protein